MNRARSLARRAALQALYQWEISGDSPAVITQQFRTEREVGNADMEYFDTLIQGITTDTALLDQAFTPLLDRALKDLDPIERAILRLGTWELRHRLDIPYRVILNEAVELAKTYGAEQSHKYINGVLDKLAQAWRTVEQAP